MFSTDFIFRQQENLVDNQKCQAGFRPLCNKILLCKKEESLEWYLEYTISDVQVSILRKTIFFAIISNLKRNAV